MSVSLKWIFISNCLLLITLLTASCNKKISQEDLSSELDNVSSWAATAKMTGDAWIKGYVPKNYAHQTLTTVQKNLQKETNTFSDSSIEPSERQTILKQLQQLQQTISQISANLQTQNRNTITAQLKQLSTQEQAIHQFAKSVGKKS